MTFRRLLLSLAASAALLAPAAASAQTQPPLDITKLKYEPIGFFKPGTPIPPDYGKACESLAPQRTGKTFNPSGVWNSFDNTIFEYYCLPFRNQDDVSANDPDGNGGESKYGYCKDPDPSDPLAQAGPEGAGTCPNHQLEYIEYYKTTMLEVLKDFNPSFRQYDFEHPEGIGRNPAIVIAGADKPDEHILIGSHYDQTTTGPASLWDSQEGHAEMIRVAKLMADYWKATGTRPSATIKFMPTDGEEDGSLGSADYVANVIVPGEEAKMRSYWNADPCAGGYPARRYGNPGDVIPVNVQIGISDDPRVQAFNETVPKLLEDVLTHIDDKITAYPDQLETFISTEENAATTDVGKYIQVSTEFPVLFSSDWTKFIAVNIPFFNPTPKVTGPSNPSSMGTPGPYSAQNPYPDAVIGFHTPVDNLQTMSRFTGEDPAGNQYPEAYMKGMEFCSNLLAWGMLQPQSGGAQTANENPVAYYEALPNEATKGQRVTFDAGSSYQYADVKARTFVKDDDLQYKWSFGDGTPAAFGKLVKHAYKAAGKYQSKLTVTNRTTNKSATMTVPIVVEAGGTANQADPPGQDVDRQLPAQNSVVACQASNGFRSVSVKPAGKGLRFDFAQTGRDPVQIDVFRSSTTKQAAAPKKVASFSVMKPFTWNGKPKKGKLAKGTYFVRITSKSPNSVVDSRAFAFERTSKFKARKPFQRTESCDLVSSFRLAAPAFGGKRKLEVGFSATKAGQAEITVFRGKKAVKKIVRKVDAPNRFQLVKIPAKPTKKFKKGEYRVVLKYTAGGDSRLLTLFARRR